MNSDLAQRAVVRTSALAWAPRAGIEEKLLEDAGSRRTALVRMPAGATLPIIAGGSLDILILDGALLAYGAGMYLHEPAGQRPLTTSRGCTLFLKQRPALRPSRAALDTRGIVFEPGISPGLSRGPLHADLDGTVTLLRFAPGAHIADHGHDDGEELFVLEGELVDEFGRYGLHDWVRQPHDSHHEVDTPLGCLTFSLAHHLGGATLPR